MKIVQHSSVLKWLPSPRILTFKIIGHTVEWIPVKPTKVYLKLHEKTLLGLFKIL